MNRKLLNFIAPAIILICFIVFTVMVITFDVAAIGPLGSKVGFSALNGAFSKVFTFNELCYELSEYLGYIAILSVFAIFVLFVLIAIQKKSLFKVDKILWLYGFSMAAVIAFYVLFEILAINMRPIIIKGELEASFPSSHTLLALCSLYFGSRVVPYFIKNKSIVVVINAALYILAFLIVILRTVSGVHWITDIIASLLLSLFLISAFETVKKTFNI